MIEQVGQVVRSCLACYLSKFPGFHEQGIRFSNIAGFICFQPIGWKITDIGLTSLANLNI